MPYKTNKMKLLPRIIIGIGLIIIYLSVGFYFGMEYAPTKTLIPCEDIQTLPEDFIGPLATYQIRSNLTEEEIVNCKYIEEVKLKWK